MPKANREDIVFKKIELEDQAELRQIVNIFKPLSCEYNFVNLFSWQKPSRLFWAKYHENLVIYDDFGKCIFMPVGKYLTPKQLKILSDIFLNKGLSHEFTLFTEEYINKFPEIKKDFIVTKDRDFAEYIYDVSKMGELKGRKLSKKKNLISQFLRIHPDYSVQPISGKDKNQVLKFTQESLVENKSPHPNLFLEIEAIEKALSFFNEINLEGILLKVKNRIVAYSVFSPINDLTYDIHFEKSDLNIKGSAQIISYETAKYLKNKCHYLNKEQDLGIKGLRNTKLSYDPSMMLEFYTLVPK